MKPLNISDNVQILEHELDYQGGKNVRKIGFNLLYYLLKSFDYTFCYMFVLFT